MRFSVSLTSRHATCKAEPARPTRALYTCSCCFCDEGIVCREHTGFSSEQESMTHLQANVPREKLIEGARAMNQFTEMFKAHLEKQAMQEPPADGEAFVVTKEIVDDFKRTLLRR